MRLKDRLTWWMIAVIRTLQRSKHRVLARALYEMAQDYDPKDTRLTDQERETVRKAAVSLCNLIDCFRGIEYRTKAEFTNRNPYTVAEFRDANLQADALKRILRSDS